MKVFKNIDDNVQEVNISQLISDLNVYQKRIFYTVTIILSGKDLSNILRLYVSGEKGTGKREQSYSCFKMLGKNCFEQKCCCYSSNLNSSL